jgi:hypothetical protein
MEYYNEQAIRQADSGALDREDLEEQAALNRENLEQACEPALDREELEQACGEPALDREELEEIEERERSGEAAEDVPSRTRGVVVAPPQHAQANRPEFLRLEIREDQVLYFVDANNKRKLDVRTPPISHPHEDLMDFKGYDFEDGRTFAFFVRKGASGHRRKNRAAGATWVHAQQTSKGKSKGKEKGKNKGKSSVGMGARGSSSSSSAQASSRALTDEICKRLDDIRKSSGTF